MFCIVLNKKGIRSGLLFFISLLLVGVALVKSWDAPEKAVMTPVYHGSDADKKIALTFNVVWGEEFIPQILNILNENAVQATFFMGGQWVDDFPELIGEIVQGGHDLGNHGYSHLHQERISKAANIEEIKKTETSIFNATGIKTKLFAPPYGEKGDVILKAAEEAGYTTIYWSIDTIDWQRPDPSVIVDRVLTKAHNGAIVLMHPTAPTVHALPNIVRELKKQDYQLVKVSSLLEALNKENDQAEEN
ncbi:MAG: polysaccharide deacetylase family protein [Desulfotomaculaceae bacterium]|nr:polysaccharide deacetylase family protein [Desulfotomaculaceae bacterium]